MAEEYRQKLIEALENIRTFHSDILDSVINLAMEGEFKEWNDATPLDTEVYLDWEFCENSEDANILHLVKLVKKVEEIHSRIASENDMIKIEDDEERCLKIVKFSSDIVSKNQKNYPSAIPAFILKI